MANRFPMIPELAIAAGRAFAESLAGETRARRARVIIARDPRPSGPMLEHAVAAGLCAGGAEAMLAGVLPTAAASLLLPPLEAEGAVMISASHNPCRDNGLKFFGRHGLKLSEPEEAALEARIRGLLREDGSPGEPAELGRIAPLRHAAEQYMGILRATVQPGLTLAGLRVALDCANGAASASAPRLLRELGAEVLLIGASPNGENINDRCGAVHPGAVAELAWASRCDLGIALDGDADRCILVDEKGHVADGDVILGICALHLHGAGRLTRSTLVATPMSNMGLELSLQERGISMLRAPIGDRNVVEAMIQGGFALGGEQSGHAVFLEHARTGDGLLTALQVAAVMKREGKRLSELRAPIRLLPQVQQTVPVARREPLEGVPEISLAIAAVRQALKEKGRILVRYSGTEPIARVMVEGEDPAAIRRHSELVCESIRRALSSPASRRRIVHARRASMPFEGQAAARG